MSNRFFSLCLAVLLISNIYFYNFALFGSDFSKQEIYLGILLNQSIHLLLFFYLIYGKPIKKLDKKTLTVLLILGLDIANEICNIFIIDFQYSYVVDGSIVGLQRICWIILFAFLGGKLFSKIKAKNLLSLAFVFFMIYFLRIGFGNSLVDSIGIVILHFILLVFIITGSNSNSRLFHWVGLGALLIALGDLAFIYSGFHGDYKYRYLYLLPRFMINFGELLIVFKIFSENYSIRMALKE